MHIVVLLPPRMHAKMLFCMHPNNAKKIWLSLFSKTSAFISSNQLIINFELNPSRAMTTQILGNRRFANSEKVPLKQETLDRKFFVSDVSDDVSTFFEPKNEKLFFRPGFEDLIYISLSSRTSRKMNEHDCAFPDLEVHET